MNTQQQKVVELPRTSSRKRIPLSQLINKINHLNFRGEPVLFNLRHKNFGNSLSLYAQPDPCFDDTLICRWVDQDGDDQRFQNYNLVNMVMTDGRCAVHVEPEVVTIDSRQVTCRLPEDARESADRGLRRFRANDIRVQLTSNGAVFPGELVDCNGFFFRVRLVADEPLSFDWINESIPVNVTLFHGRDVVFVGDCKIVRGGDDPDSGDYVLRPNREQMQRFKAKEFRPERREMIPNPSLVFKHPLTSKMTTLKVNDLSGTGFGVVEQYADSLLLPGMILPEVSIQFTNRIKLQCKAQVIHRKIEDDVVYSGIAILDIDVQDHLDLVGMLYQAKDPDTMISNPVDLDALWDFFFETGFIYPQKYLQLIENKDHFKQTYKKLYNDNPTIARHFTHMKHGHIQGHFAMLRLYEKTWIVHHHAALPNSKKAGLIVLGRMTEFINEIYSLRTSNFKYSSGYYRSDNKFPVKFFGGFAKKMGNPAICSIDPYAFVNFARMSSGESQGQGSEWDVSPSTVADLEDLGGYYSQRSGEGLSLAATDMLPSSLQQGGLGVEYEKLGFKREIHRLSVRRHGQLKAILVVNITDIGLNFSELSNAVHVYIIDDSGFTKKSFSTLLSRVADMFGLERFPAMVYPYEFVEKVSFVPDKTYNLMTVSLAYWDDYMRYTKDFLKRAKLN